MSMAGVTPTEVLRYIKKELGDCVYDISQEMDDDEIMRIVFDESLPTFSRYFPYTFNVVVREKDKIMTDSSNCYRIPEIEGIRIEGVSKVILGDYYNFSVNAIPVTTNPFNSQMMADYRSMTNTPVTWHFVSPNHITIMPQLYASHDALVTIKAVHPKHLGTIPVKMKDYFQRLAYLDVLEALKPYRQRYQSISTPYGNIELLIDDIQNAHNEREELLAKFQEKHAFQATAMKIISA